VKRGLDMVATVRRVVVKRAVKTRKRCSMQQLALKEGECER